MNHLIKQLRTDRVENHSNNLRVISWNRGEYITLAADADGFSLHLDLTVDQARQLASLLVTNADVTAAVKPEPRTWYVDGTLDPAHAEIVDIWCGRKD